jgi:hypothetical protein
MTITREEAIEVLKLQISNAEFYARYANNDRDAEKELKDAEAFRMAIEALSAEAISEDTQIKTELAHIKARLENVEKKLQGLANDVLIGRSHTG